MSYKSNTENLIPPHGGYKNLESYKTAVIISDGTARFCQKWIRDLKLSSQMDGAARSGKQCIAEGSLNSGTSKKLELKLVGNARGSYGELLEDFEDFLRQRDLPLWGKDNPRAVAIRRIAYKSNKSYTSYKSYLESRDAETAANTLICLIHQENYLLDQLLRSLEKAFMEKGGFTERLYNARKTYTTYKSNMSYKTKKSY
jgi:four helix bundle suffix protein